MRTSKKKRLYSREPVWIRLSEAVEFHDYLLARLGGLRGFPHPERLDSALSAPRNSYEYSHGDCDLFDLAGVYLYHIAKGHAFTDGNKRTAYTVALAFLSVNGINILLPRNVIQLADAAIHAADGQITRDDLAVIMREMPRRNRRRRPRIVQSPPRRQPKSRHCSRRKRLL